MSTATTSGPGQAAPQARAMVVEAPRAAHRTLASYLFIPILLAVVLLALWLWARGQDLNSTERQRVHLDFILPATWQHIKMTAVSTAIVLLIAVPLGILLTRPFARRVTPYAIAIFNVGQGIPTVGLLAVLMFPLPIGFWTVVIGLVAYCTLAVLRNTMVGLEQVDESVIEAARGMGMTKAAVLTKIELPLAVPVIMAGVRTALVINVGTATLGTLFNAGGLGDIINTGITRSDELITVIGSVLVAVLALLIDYLGGVAEDVLRPRGL